MGRIAALHRVIDTMDVLPHRGIVTRIGATHVTADGPLARIGDLCRVLVATDRECLAEVSAVGPDGVVLVPLDAIDQIEPGMAVTADRSRTVWRAGDAFRARAVDGLGRAIDDGGPIFDAAQWSQQRRAVAVLDRATPTAILPTGIRAIDAFLTLGAGQRIGIFSASGVGKSSLIQQLARQLPGDHIVLCMVGERGREVEAFWREHLEGQPDSRVTIVAATSDAPAAMRVRAVEQALSIAEFWRNSGRHCILIVDSITRYAMALREIGLASGEPPTLRGYTPNVLKALPRIVEQCGCQRGGGVITGIFTVLSETDDVDDPIVEVMKSLLDGHIILSRALAQHGQFPAIDILKSLSRLASDLVPAQHRDHARTVVQLLARYEEARILIDSGLYTKGNDRQIDEAIACRPAIIEFLRQEMDVDHAWMESVAGLAALSGRTKSNV